MKFMCKNKLLESLGMKNELFKVEGRKPDENNSLTKNIRIKIKTAQR
jgi:hypothetical protein